MKYLLDWWGRSLAYTFGTSGYHLMLSELWQEVLMLLTSAVLIPCQNLVIIKFLVSMSRKPKDVSLVLLVSHITKYKTQLTPKISISNFFSRNFLTWVIFNSDTCFKVKCKSIYITITLIASFPRFACLTYAAFNIPPVCSKSENLNLLNYL